MSNFYTRWRYEYEQGLPLTQTQIWVGRAVAAFLFWLDFKIAFYIVTHLNSSPANLEQPFPWENGWAVAYFVYLFLLVPGGILFWPAFALWVYDANDKIPEKK